MAEFIQKHKLFSFYSTLMLLVVIVAIFAPWLAPGDAFSSNMSVMYCLASFMVHNYPCSWVLPLLLSW